jgi:hypothetical protein
MLYAKDVDGSGQAQGWAKLVSNLTFSKRKALVFSKN